MNITFDKHSLIIDGKRVFIRSGAFHYFRTPGYESALDRFSKLKAGGYNAVDIYFYWQYHSKVQGDYDFSDYKDIRKVLKAAKEAGLFVIARPGPFINAEVNAGGFPLWLLENKNVIPRNRIGTEYHYSENYMELIREWYDVIIPIINEFDNVILFQIENEYATDSMEEDYMKELYKMARERGITCPLFHNDAYAAGLWADVVDIYAGDLYPYINPNQNWREDTFCFDTLDNYEEMSESCKPEAPKFIAEMQAGWFDKWDGMGYEHIRNSLGDEHINIMTKTALSQGVTIFNHYMAIGGTSWDNIACDEVYTSYEFTAPIDEYGKLHPNYFKAKSINYFIKAFNFTNTDSLECNIYGENIYAKLRHDNENDCNWLFLRNLNKESVDIQVDENRKTIVKPFDMKILPIGLKLKACEIAFSENEIFGKLESENIEYIFFINDENCKIEMNDGSIINGNQKDFNRISFEKNNKTTQFVFLNKETADKTWIFDDKVIFNAQYALKDGTVAIEKTSEIAYLDIEHGFSTRNFKPYKLNDEKEFTLKNINVTFVAPEIDENYDYSNWTPIYGETDALSCHAFDEFIWYKGKISNKVREITLSARHLFALYINGKEILSRNSYKIDKLQQISETIQLHLQPKDLPKEENELTILVQNLGFDKGFSGDTNHPRGLITFEVTPKESVQLYVRENLTLIPKNNQESEAPYLVKISAKFAIEEPTDVVFAKYLFLQDFPYRRATIYLNGVKIGRYIKRTQVQDKFYLLNNFLKKENQIDIVIWQKARNIVSKWDFKNEIKNVIIKIGDMYKYQLFN